MLCFVQYAPPISKAEHLFSPIESKFNKLCLTCLRQSSKNKCSSPGQSHCIKEEDMCKPPLLAEKSQSTEVPCSYTEKERDTNRQGREVIYQGTYWKLMHQQRLRRSLLDVLQVIIPNFSLCSLANTMLTAILRGRVIALSSSPHHTSSRGSPVRPTGPPSMDHTWEREGRM